MVRIGSLHQKIKPDNYYLRGQAELASAHQAPLKDVIFQEDNREITEKSQTKYYKLAICL